MCPPPSAHGVSPCRFRVSRIPEQKPGTTAGTGGDPSRGPLPAGSGTRPSWLKSTESHPEVRRGHRGGNPGVGGVQGSGRGWDLGALLLLGFFFLGETAWCCTRLFTLKPTEGSSQPCPALSGLSSGAQTFWDFFFQT